MEAKGTLEQQLNELKKELNEQNRHAVGVNASLEKK